MQTLQHTPQCAVQAVIQHLFPINDLSQPQLHNEVRAALKKSYANEYKSVVKEPTCAVSETNVMLSFCGDAHKTCC